MGALDALRGGFRRGEMNALVSTDFAEVELRVVATGRTFHSKSNIEEVNGLPYVRYSPDDVRITEAMMNLGKVYLMEFRGIGRIFTPAEMEDGLEEKLAACNVSNGRLRAEGFDPADVRVLPLYLDQRAEGLYYCVDLSPRGSVIDLIAWPETTDAEIERARRSLAFDYDIDRVAILRLRSVIHFEKVRALERP